jgi:hypothetical protein
MFILVCDFLLFKIRHLSFTFPYLHKLFLWVSLVINWGLSAIIGRRPDGRWLAWNACQTTQLCSQNIKVNLFYLLSQLFCVRTFWGRNHTSLSDDNFSENITQEVRADSDLHMAVHQNVIRYVMTHQLV